LWRYLVILLASFGFQVGEKVGSYMRLSNFSIVGIYGIVVSPITIVLNIQ